MGNLISLGEEEEEVAGEPPAAGPPHSWASGGPGWYAGQPAALRRGFEREWRAARACGGAEEGCQHGRGAPAHGGAREPEEPLAPASAAEYLREILTCEESLLAAFQPVLRAARCACPDGARVVDRGAFAQAVVRISAHFLPSEPIVLRMACAGPPLSADEALGHFRMALCLLADRLGEVHRGPSPAHRHAPHEAGAAAPTPRGGAVAAEAGAASPRSAALRGAGPAGAALAAGASVPPASSASSPGPSPRALSSPEQQERDEVARALEASWARVHDLEQMLDRAGALLVHQGEEVHRLERLERDLEGQRDRRRRARRSTPPPRRRCAAAGRRGPRSQPGCARVDLGSLKQHVTAARMLRARMEALEAQKADLDDSEDVVAELADEP